MANSRFIVIGLGTFGAALAARLCKNHCRVTGVDSQKERVEPLKSDLYEAVIGDATDRATLEHLHVKDADAVMISLGEDITRSLLATLHARELGARRIIVKGVTPEHGKILKSLGVERVVFPESEIAVSLADRMTWPNIVDFVPIDPEYSFFEISVPDSFVGKSLQELDLRRKYGVWIVGVKDALSGKLQMLPGAEFKFNVDQLLLMIGKQDEVQGMRQVQ
ncbi:MAG: TrkA family potassium uptake protein [Pirellulaceae bacterium]